MTWLLLGYHGDIFKSLGAIMGDRLIYDQRERLLAWAEDKIGLGKFRDDAHAIGLEREGELVAVSVYDNFSLADCYVHLASDGSKRWMNRAFLVAGFAYPFLQLNLRRITGIVPASNHAALALNEHLGYAREGYCRHALPNDDVVILGMLREDCKWINLKETPCATN